MNQTYEIFVDSAGSVTKEQSLERNIHILSYICSIEGQDILCYDENQDNEAVAKYVYSALREGKNVRTTLVNSAKFIEAATPYIEAGKDILFITISSGLSGTFNQAKFAAEELREKYPDRKVFAIDSLNASYGEGLIALKAAELREEGIEIEECVEELQNLVYYTNAVCSPDELKYLHRSGRISATVAIAGALLNIKPVLKGDEQGKFQFVRKERGRKKALLALAEEYVKSATFPESEKVYITHCDCRADADMLAELLKERGAKEVFIAYYDVCTGAHIGPGNIALFFVGKNKKKDTEPEKISFVRKFINHIRP